jgi:cytoskeletal protein RodZ
MIIHRNVGYPHLILLFTLVVSVMMIFVLIIIVAGAALYAQAISNTTTPHVTISFVGDTSPIAGIDHVSVAGTTTYNAATSSKNIEQKILTVSWGDGTTSQSKITRIPSSSEGKWGPLYHKYDSPTAVSHPHAIVATMQMPSYSSSNKGFVQLKSEPYLVNVQKDQIKTSSMDSLRSSTYVVSKNDGLSLNLISHSVNVIALTIIGSVTACSIYMARYRSSNQNMASTIDAYRDKK